MATAHRNVAARLELLRERIGAVLDGRPEALAPLPADDALLSLAARLKLSALDVDALLLALGAQLDPELGAYADGAALTVGLALRALLPSIELRLAAQADGFPRRLADRGMVQRPRRVGLQAELVPTRRAMAAALGRDPFDDLPRYARLRPADLVERTFEQSPAVVARALLRREGDGSTMVIVAGEPGVGKTTFARAVACSLAPRALEIDMALACVTAPPSEAGNLVAEVVTDAALFGLPVIIDDTDGALGPRDPSAVELAARLDDIGASVILVAADPSALHTRLVRKAALRVDLRPPGAALRTVMWRRGLEGQAPAHLLADVGESFQLTPRQIVNAATFVEKTGVAPRTAAAAQLGSAGVLLEQTTTRRGLDRLVLPADTRAQLDEIVAAIEARQTLMHEWGLGASLSRGRGLSALFDGEPGTGKTAACEAIAVEAGQPLLRVNVASLVDKYVGETEKNLVRVFAQARAGGAILMFDEAESMFGARTAVRGANDRYANLEVNLLLQLMEEHTGVVFLTTNLKANLDTAFLRRLTFKVEFALPDAALRAQIWRAVLPPDRVACTGADHDELARRFALSGGSIQAAATRAGYRAAARARKVTMDDLVECAILECETLGHVVEIPRKAREVM